MGTRVDIVGWGGDGMGVVDACVRLVARHEAMWSVFRPASEVSRLNAAARVVPLPAGGAGGEAPGCPGAVGDPGVGASGAVHCPGVSVSAATDQLLRDALALSDATGGAFNPLIGPLVGLWDVKGMREAFLAGDSLPSAPLAADIESALRAVDARLLRRVGPSRWALGGQDAPAGGGGWRADDCWTLGEGSAGGGGWRADDCWTLGEGSAGGAGRWADEGGRAASEEPSGAGALPSLDLGGIAKGRTADECRDLAVDMGARGVLVSIGTSSIAAYATRPDGGPWRVGLRDPDSPPTAVASVIELPCEGLASLSTSGDNLGPLGPAARTGPVGRLGPGGRPGRSEEWGGGARGTDGAARGEDEAGVLGAGRDAQWTHGTRHGQANGGARETPRETEPGAERGPRGASGGVERGASGGALRPGGRLVDRLLAHHIIDPRTGRPASGGARQVSVLAGSGVLAEALSTAILVDPSCVRGEAVEQWARARGIDGRWRIAG